MTGGKFTMFFVLLSLSHVVSSLQSQHRMNHRGIYELNSGLPSLLYEPNETLLVVVLNACFKK